jgi:hypothetical protein
VAVLAIETQLALVVIRVAVRARRAHPTEDRIFMATTALRLPVRAAEQEARLGMIECQWGSERGPPLGCMAVFTIVSERAVRIPR